MGLGVCVVEIQLRMAVVVGVVAHIRSAYTTTVEKAMGRGEGEQRRVEAVCYA